MSHDDIGIILKHVDSRFDLMLELIQTLAKDVTDVKRTLAVHSNKLERLDLLVPLVKEHEPRLNKLETMPGRA